MEMEITDMGMGIMQDMEIMELMQIIWAEEWEIMGWNKLV